jgi:nicotinate-nucleotide--dimethylbenzimidazole phosphoribosyltransferase
MAQRAKKNGTAMLATGEMGIGNTTPSSALLSALLCVDPEEVTGKGTGLDEQGVRHKTEVIRRILATHSDLMADPFSALAAVGGLEIAGICGLCLGGAALKMVVVVDGFISSAGALVAMLLCPYVRDYLFFSHQSTEKGHALLFDKMQIRPILHLDMRLGEGTGAAIAMQVIENSLRVLNEMATFEEVGIAPGA